MRRVVAPPQRPSAHNRLYSRCALSISSGCVSCAGEPTNRHAVHRPKLASAILKRGAERPPRPAMRAVNRSMSCRLAAGLALALVLVCVHVEGLRSGKLQLPAALGSYKAPMGAVGRKKQRAPSIGGLDGKFCVLGGACGWQGQRESGSAARHVPSPATACTGYLPAQRGNVPNESPPNSVQGCLTRIGGAVSASIGSKCGSIRVPITRID